MVLEKLVLDMKSVHCKTSEEDVYATILRTLLSSNESLDSNSVLQLRGPRQQIDVGVSASEGVDMF